MALDMNLAYDYENLDLMDEREEEYSERLKKKRYSNKRKHAFDNLRIIVGAVIVLMLFSFMTYGNVELSKLYSENSELESTLEYLVSENTALESEMAQKTGLAAVEEYAENQLGLQKLDKSQIEYVQIDETTTAETVSADDENIFVKIKNWFVDALEYLGL